jgi:elongation factor P
MLSISELRKDTLIQINGIPYRVAEYQHSKMGRGGAVAKTKLKNLIDGTVVSKTFQGNDKIQSAEIQYKSLQFLYKQNNQLYLMNIKTYDQISVTIAVAGSEAVFLSDGMEVTGLFFEDKLIGLELPKIILTKVTNTEPGVKGDTVSASLKPATIEPGAIVQVPLFVKNGDTIKVDTRSGDYVGRA